MSGFAVAILVKPRGEREADGELELSLGEVS